MREKKSSQLSMTQRKQFYNDMVVMETVSMMWLLWKQLTMMWFLETVDYVITMASCAHISVMKGLSQTLRSLRMTSVKSEMASY